MVPSIFGPSLVYYSRRKDGYYLSNGSQVHAGASGPAHFSGCSVVKPGSRAASWVTIPRIRVGAKRCPEPKYRRIRFAQGEVITR